MQRLGLWWSLIAATACSTAGPRGAPELSAYAPGYHGIVFTAVPVVRVASGGSVARPMTRVPYGDGGHLTLLNKDGSTRILTADFDSAADPAVSFDGKRILFAGKKTAADHWNIFEMAANGSVVRQITRNAGNCRSPMYQSAMFYLNDARPSYQVTFVSDAAGELNEYGPQQATNLYSMRLDGSGLRRLTYAVSASYDPFQMQDGRLLFSNWQRSHLGNGAQGRVDLFAVHLDGTDYSAFSGIQGRRVKHMSCTTSKGKVVFIESDVPTSDGAGSIGTLSLRRNLHSYKGVTTAADGLFYSPSPLPDGSVLVSRRQVAGGVHAIYRLDLESRSLALVYEQQGTHSIQAVALTQRPEPDGHSSVVEDDQGWSKFYGLNVYESDLKREWLPPGTARRLRVIEGLPRSFGPSTTTDTLSGMIQKRLLGELDLDDDGSFQVLVPPNTPVQLQIVDREGMALRTSAWIWAKNKENRGCIGCHEDNERTPENVFAKALSHPAADLMLAPEKRRTVDFRRDVQPILTAKCANQACHGGSIQPSWLGSTHQGKAGFTTAYESLLSLTHAPGPPGSGKYVDPGRARTSRLIRALSGKNTARPWDRLAFAPAPRRMPPPGSPPLTGDESRTIIEWIDLGAQFNALPSNAVAAGAGATGGQR